MINPNCSCHVSDGGFCSECSLAALDEIKALYITLQGKDKQLAEARADAEHWKGECSALQRMVHEARAEIERLNKDFDALNLLFIKAGKNAIKYKAQVEQMREALEKCRDTFASYVLDHSGKLHITPIAPIDLCAPIREKIAKNQRMVDLCDAALAAERGRE